MSSSEFFWIMIISVSGMWALVAMVRTIVDGWVRARQSRLELERQYLAQMMQEIEEIKQRLDALRREDTKV